MSERQRGFSLLELMVVIVIFLIVSGAVIQLLNAVQIRYRSEQQFLDSFSDARRGLDLMVRDIHNAGYPPPFTYAGNQPQQPTGPTPLTYPPGIWTDPLAADPMLQQRFALGVLGVDAAGNPSTTCTVDTVNPGAGTCRLPNPWDLILELDVNPEDFAAQVEWVRYTLERAPGTQTSTLRRVVAAKIPGAGVNVPAALPTANLPPFVENVVQNPTQPVNVNTNPALFSYECDSVPTAVTVCRADQIRNVYIIMQVQSAQQDIRTRLRQITLRGAATTQYPER
ncbi:MAG: prepilin-type N-terminal cleavage/methylation domain-containing protein [Acidobacteria bacterium]|nr:prepilin-type N-terminal cleavage/methylation domain-containing protein [Acidobacteriota bacterium]